MQLRRRGPCPGPWPCSPGRLREQAPGLGQGPGLAPAVPGSGDASPLRPPRSLDFEDKQPCNSIS